jgi:hypothetical protein
MQCEKHIESPNPNFTTDHFLKGSRRAKPTIHTGMKSMPLFIFNYLDFSLLYLKIEFQN